MGAPWKGRWRRWSGAQVGVAGMLAVLAFTVPGPAGAAAPVREWPAGALDPSFAFGGVLTASFANPPSRQEGRDAAVQPDGKIVVLTLAGSTSYLSRYLADGEVDTTFGSGGSVLLPSDGYDAYSSLTVDAEGRIVVAGTEPTAEWQAPDKSLALARVQGVVYRFLADGAPDSSFGVGGKAVVAVSPPEGLTPGSASTTPFAVLTASDGSVVIGGTVRSVCFWEVGFQFGQFAEESGTFVARLGANGAPDEQFGSSGIVSTHGRCKVEQGATDETFGGLAQASSETVLALVSHTEDNTWRFRTYSPTGALSEAQAPAEDEAPVQITMVGDHYLVLSIHYLYVGSGGGGVGGTEVLRRFDAQGVPDPTFDTNGRLAIPMACELGPGCFNVLPDGRILVAGLLSRGQVGVRRYLADGSADGSFGAPPWLGGGGAAWAELPGGNEMDTVNKLLILHGQPLVAGAEQVPGNGYAESQTALTLFQADGGFSSNPPPPGPGEEPPPPSKEEPLPPSEPPLLLGHEPPPLVAYGGGGPKTSAGGNSPAGTGSDGRLSSAIEAALAALLHPKGQTATISGLLKHGLGKLLFDAPVQGTLAVEWTSLPAQTGKSLRAHKAQPVMIATGSETFSAAGHGTITLHLTAVGRKLLKKGRALRVNATASFWPSEAALVRRGATILVRD